MSAVIRALSEWAAGGSALAALVTVLGTVSAGIFGVIYRRYLGILGADRRRPAERKAYDALRDSLAGSNLATRLYARWLTAFLDRVDRFFGDAGMADQTLFPRAFGLRTPAPLWTAPAFDRCLLLALIYPVATIIVIWGISGHVGPAEAALELAPNMPGWRRGLAGILFVVQTAGAFSALHTTGWRKFAWILFAFAGFVGAADVAGGSGLLAISVAVAAAIAGAIVVGGAGAVAGVVAGAAVMAAEPFFSSPVFSLFLELLLSLSLSTGRIQALALADGKVRFCHSSWR